MACMMKSHILAYFWALLVGRVGEHVADFGHPDAANGVKELQDPHRVMLVGRGRDRRQNLALGLDLSIKSIPLHLLLTAFTMVLIELSTRPEHT